MINGHTISLVIPCKNEASSLPSLLQNVPKIIDEVLIIDNNSNDDTKGVAIKLGARVITETRTDPHGIGYGYAHQTGIRAAKCDIIVTMDGDGTYPMKQISEVITYLQMHDLDFVSCNRFPLIHKKAISLTRKVGVAILNVEVKLFHGHPIKDILSGMWVVKKKAAQQLALQEGGWNLSPEIKLKAIAHKKVKFAEYHIDHNYRTGGASKQQIWRTGFEHLIYIFNCKLVLITRSVHFVLVNKSQGKKTHSRYLDFLPATNLE